MRLYLHIITIIYIHIFTVGIAARKYCMLCLYFQYQDPIPIIKLYVKSNSVYLLTLLDTDKS